LVVKNGSKIFPTSSGAIPQPVSVTASITYWPGLTSAWWSA